MSSMTTDVGRRIVCAAIRDVRSGFVVAGVRHFDEIMRKNAKQYDTESSVAPNWRQGFLDNNYQFLTRREAWPIAEAAGQIIRRCGGDDAQGGMLYSENLY